MIQKEYPREFCNVDKILLLGLNFGHAHASSVTSVISNSDPKDCSLPVSSVHGIIQESILEWIAISSSRGSSQPRVCTHISYESCIGRRIYFPLRHLGSPPLALNVVTKICDYFSFIKIDSCVLYDFANKLYFRGKTILKKLK